MNKDYKPEIIQVSFKTNNLDDKMLLDWLQDKFRIYGKSNYIKLILKEKMQQEVNS